VIRIFCRVVFRRAYRNCFGKTLENKENDNGKLNEMFGRNFDNFFGEKSNVKPGKLRKAGGGGLVGVKG
jgi:hypothetical protein